MSELKTPWPGGRQDGVESGLRASDDMPLFSTKPAERGGLPMTVWGVAVAIVVITTAAMVFAGRKKGSAAPTSLQPPDAYAASLPISKLAMSESSNLSGGKLTYLDGHVQNAGSRTINGATLQVVFQNDEALPPQIDVVPLTLIRMRQPYIDTEPVSADPLKPGEDKEFRLIFESIPPNWNTQMPEIRIIHTDSR